MGGSPAWGAPKVLVFTTCTPVMSNQPFAGAGAWLVKFQAGGAQRGLRHCQTSTPIWRALWVDIPATRYFDLGPKLAGFGIERFDVERGMRVPVHTLAGLLHANFSAAVGGGLHHLPQSDLIPDPQSGRGEPSMYERGGVNNVRFNR